MKLAARRAVYRVTMTDGPLSANQPTPTTVSFSTNPISPLLSFFPGPPFVRPFPLLPRSGWRRQFHRRRPSFFTRSQFSYYLDAAARGATETIPEARSDRPTAELLRTCGHCCHAAASDGENGFEMHFLSWSNLGLMTSLQGS